MEETVKCSTRYSNLVHAFEGRTDHVWTLNKLSPSLLEIFEKEEEIFGFNSSFFKAVLDCSTNKEQVTIKMRSKFKIQTLIFYLFIIAVFLVIAIAEKNFSGVIFLILGPIATAEISRKKRSFKTRLNNFMASIDEK